MFSLETPHQLPEEILSTRKKVVINEYSTDMPFKEFDLLQGTVLVYGTYLA